MDWRICWRILTLASKGGLFDDSKTLSKLIGRPTTTLAESVSHLFNVNN